MAYTAIPDTDIDADSPITVSLMTALRDNPTAIANGDAGAPKIQTAAIADHSVIYGKLPSLYAGSYQFFNSHTAKSVTTTGYVKKGQGKVGQAGTIRVGMALTRGAGGSISGRVYVNGVATGAVHTNSAGGTIVYTDDITVSPGDLVQVYCKIATYTGTLQYWYMAANNPNGGGY